jgi:uncharacterized membrane protein
MSAFAKSLSGAAAAGAIATALAALSAPASAAELEKCYGVAMKGQNDCSATATHSCAGHQTVDYDGTSFKLVATGTCTTMQTPLGPGSLTPIQRPS